MTRRTEYKVRDVVFGMRRLEAGSFWMGAAEDDRFDDSERPCHLVTLTNDFELADDLVTYALWEAVFGIRLEDPRGYLATKVNSSVGRLTWVDAVAFCIRLNLMLDLDAPYRMLDASGNSYYDSASHRDFFNWVGKSRGEIVTVWDQSATGFRLPTEAEWEYAAAAGRRRDRPSPGEAPPYLRSHLKPWDIDLRGLHWCWDPYGPYTADDQTNPTGSGSGRKRVLRPGDASYAESDIPWTRRGALWQRDTYDGVGMRLARSLRPT